MINSYSQVQQYQTVPEPGNSRKSEAWALMQAAVKIKQAVEAGVKEEIEAAVRLNWRLWTILQADILGPNNELPAEIRGNILSLCKFVDKRTMEYFAELDVAKLDVLMNINRELASGLNQVPTESAPVEGSAAESNQAPAAPEGINLADLEA